MITAVALNPAVDKIYYVDNFSAGGMYRAGRMLKSAGGKGVNVARVLSILGEQVGVTGFTAGESGRWIGGQLEKYGVEVGFIDVEGETRTNNNIIDTACGRETEILEPGPSITGGDIESFLQVFDKILDRSKVVVCSGGLPSGVPCDIYRTLIEKAAKKGAAVILDTSGEMLEEGIKACPALIKPNLRELGKYAGRELGSIEEIEQVCLDIVHRGVKIVVASMGKRGALAVTHNRTLLAEVPDVKVVNTIGSGDSMVAGLAAAMRRGAGLSDMLLLGMACASSNACFEKIGMIDAAQVAALLTKIKVSEVRAV